MFSSRVFDYLEPDAVLFSGFCCIHPGVALIDVGQLNVRAGHLLHLFGQYGDLLAVPKSTVVTLGARECPAYNNDCTSAAFGPVRRRPKPHSQL